MGIVAENQKLLKDLEIHLKRINGMLSSFVSDREKKVHLEELRDEVIFYILETNQCITICKIIFRFRG